MREAAMWRCRASSAVFALVLWGCMGDTNEGPGFGSTTPTVLVAPDQYLALSQYAPNDNLGRHLTVWENGRSWEFNIYGECESRTQEGVFDDQKWQELMTTVPRPTLLALYAYADLEHSDCGGYVLLTDAGIQCVVGEAIEEPSHRMAFEYLDSLFRAKEQQTLASSPEPRVPVGTEYLGTSEGSASNPPVRMPQLPEGTCPAE